MASRASQHQGTTPLGHSPEPAKEDALELSVFDAKEEVEVDASPAMLVGQKKPSMAVDALAAEGPNSPARRSAPAASAADITVNPYHFDSPGRRSSPARPSANLKAMAYFAASSRRESLKSLESSNWEDGRSPSAAGAGGGGSISSRIFRRMEKQQRQIDAMQKTLEGIATHIGAETHNAEAWGDEADAAFYGRTFGCALGIAEEQLEELHAAFDRFDVNNDHSMDTSEIGAMLEELGVPVTDEEIQELFEAFDVDGDESFTFDELVLLLAGQGRKNDSSSGGGDFDRDDEPAKLKASAQIAARLLGLGTRTKSPRSLSSMVNKHMIEMRSITAFTENAAARAGAREKSVTLSRSCVVECIDKFFPIHPHSISHGAWDLSMSVLLVVVLITLPVTIAFDKIAEEMFWFNFIVDCLFIIDVTKNFLTGYVSTRILKMREKDRHCTLDPVILSWRKIWFNYATTWFIPDIVSSVPIDAIFRWGFSDSDGRDVASISKTLKLMRLARLAKLFRLLRMSRAFRYIRFAKSYIEDKLKIRIPMYVIKMGRLLMLIAIISHVMGCVNFFAVRSFDFPPESWVAQQGVQHATGYEQYTWSMFKALYTVIGGEEMLPSGVAVGCASIEGSSWCEFESWLQLMSLYVGVIIFALVVGEFASIVQHMDMAASKYQDMFNATNEYMVSAAVVVVVVGGGGGGWRAVHVVGLRHGAAARRVL